MSKKGKAIALSSARAAARKVVAESLCINSEFKSLMMYGVQETARISVALVNRTPHQYFNSAGKIDKRKVRRHDRKNGTKSHTILRGK